MKILDPKKDYKSVRNLVYSCQYHVIFTPKYRRDILRGEVGEKVKEYFLEMAKNMTFRL